MRTNKLTLLVLIFCFGISSILLASPRSFKGSGSNNESKSTHDTSGVNKYIRKALSFVYYPKYVKKMKADIDSAESLCNKENMEFPALLHLARAEYFFITGDFKSASQEAAISEKKSVSSEDNLVLARTLNFLGRYSHRTGFYKESIDYFNKSIDLCREKQDQGHYTYGLL